MNIAERLPRIQKLSNLYIDRSIEFCDSSSTVMDELKDHIYYLLESPAYGNSTESIVKDFDPQLASLAFHLENSPKKQICFDSFLIVGGVGR